MAVAGSSATVAQAELITFTHSGTASGQLAGNPFNDSPYVITAVGDTDDREAFTIGDGWGIQHQSASITIDGAGTFDFIGETHTLVNNEVQPDIGAVLFHFGDPDVVSNWITSGVDGAYHDWEMLTSIGPITTNIASPFGLADAMQTTGGVLEFSPGSVGVAVTFSAVVVPAPGVLALLGMAGMFRVRRRRG